MKCKKKKNILISVIMLFALTPNAQTYAQIDSVFFKEYGKKFDYLINDIRDFNKIHFESKEPSQKITSVAWEDHISMSYISIVMFSRDYLNYLQIIYEGFEGISNKADRINYAAMILRTINYTTQQLNYKVKYVNVTLDFLSSNLLITVGRDYRKYTREILNKLEVWDNNLRREYPEIPASYLK